MKNKPASLLVVPLEKALSGISHLGVIDRWLATPKRVRDAHLSLSRGRKSNMQQNTKKHKITQLNYGLRT